MTISERIFKIMGEKKITQLELSKNTGIGQSTISDWKTKKTNPSADKIMILCATLEVTPEDLLQDTMTPEQKVKKINKDLEEGKITLNEARECLGLKKVEPLQQEDSFKRLHEEDLWIKENLD